MITNTALTTLKPTFRGGLLHPEELRIYPNPTRDNVLVVARMDIGAGYELTVFDLNGKLLAQQVGAFNGNAIRVNLKNLPVGLYGIRLESNESRWHGRVLRQ